MMQDNERAKVMTKNKTTKNKINKQAFKKFVVKPVAFTALLILASYGSRHLLSTLTEPASLFISILMIGALVYIIVFED